MTRILLALLFTCALSGQPPVIPPAPGTAPDVQLPNGKSQREEILKLDHKKNLEDTAMMAKLAEEGKVPVGILDINLYRDDLSTVAHQPVLNATDIPFEVTGKDIILMDDVLYTGRTIRAALDALFDHGRAARVQLLVLIDRGHREIPIEAQFTGRMVQTTDIEIIEVKFQEIDGMEKVLLVEKCD